MVIHRVIEEILTGDEKQHSDVFAKNLSLHLPPPLAFNLMLKIFDQKCHLFPFLSADLNAAVSLNQHLGIQRAHIVRVVAKPKAHHVKKYKWSALQCTRAAKTRLLQCLMKEKWKEKCKSWSLD